MKSRIFNKLSLISATLLACTVVVWALSFWTDARKDHASFSDNFHVGFYAGRIDFFSDKHGPYHGSVISLSSGQESAFPAICRTVVDIRRKASFSSLLAPGPTVTSSPRTPLSEMR